MHFQFLIEDCSGEIMMRELVPRIIAPGDSVDYRGYKGVGRLRPGLKPADAQVRTLLDKLPALLAGFKKSLQSIEHRIVVVCDLDNKDKAAFLQQLNQVALQTDTQGEVIFCLAVEEGEAWLLGDREAVLAAYPKAKKKVLDAYKQDSICGTWEKLADAVYPGGAKALGNFVSAGAAKAEWAERIPPHMDFHRNLSPSFCHFWRAVHRASHGGEGSEDGQRL